MNAFQEFFDLLRAAKSWKTFEDNQLWLGWVEKLDDRTLAIIASCGIDCWVLPLHGHVMSLEAEMKLSEVGYVLELYGDSGSPEAVGGHSIKPVRTRGSTSPFNKASERASAPRP